MIFIFSWSQRGTAQSFRFEKTFGDISSGTKTIQLPDSGFIFTSSVWVDSNYTTHLLISRVDKLSNLIWTKQFDRVDNAMNVSALVADGKYCIASIESENFYTNVTTCVILKIDSQGQVIWEKELYGFDSQRILGLDKVSTSRYILVGNVYYGNDGDCYALTLDTGGNLLWCYRFGSNIFEAFIGVQATHDHNLVIVGISKNGNDPGKLTLMKVDTDGNIIWNHRFAWACQVTPWSIVEAKNHDFVVGGVYDPDTSLHPWYPALIRFDSTGNLKWLRYYLGDWSVAENFSSKETNDEGIVGLLEVEHFPQGSEQQPAGLFKTDANGIPEWGRLYLDTAMYFPWNVIVTSDHGYAVTGGSRSNVRNAFLVKTDSEGKTSCNDLDIALQTFTDPNFSMDSTGVIKSGGQLGDIILSESFIKIPNSTLCFDIDSISAVNTIVASSPNLISLFPNPVQTQLTISINSPSDNLATPANEVSIRVYDLQGRMIVLPTTFTNTQAQLNTITLAGGFYTVQIINDKTGESRVRKFVKQ
ncbi:MAG TPA: T9SS type A sorting domain-containing protein [Chitinophagales bacterium]|nr:T9SS type A sorting domain-containing protein [Chitinophagales bacterium]